MGRERPKAARQRERENRRIPGLRELVGCGVGEENVGVCGRTACLNLRLDQATTEGCDGGRRWAYSR